MSLYYEAATIFDTFEDNGDSLKARIYSNKNLKSNPGHLYAVVSESAKWSSILKDVIETSGVLKEEKKLTPALALLLTHDLLLAKRGIVAAATHPLKVAITRHKARLSAELSKIRIKRGFGTVEDLRKDVNAVAELRAREGVVQRPRWIRVNAIVTSLKAELRSTFRDWRVVDSIAEVTSAAPDDKMLYVDENIPNLIALPPNTTFTIATTGFDSGNLIFQDKASCFPAVLLNPGSEGDVIDATAAPGNKTTHLAALLTEAQPDTGRESQSCRIYAYERDKARAIELQKMVTRAHAGNIVTVRAGADFLSSNPNSPEYSNVRSLLLDPSCSGSGMPRDDKAFTFVLPAQPSALPTQPAGGSKKRKRQGTQKESVAKPASREKDGEDETLAARKDPHSDLPTRLANLSAFQLRIVTHAMRFPAAQRITYSTCSIHYAENESVVLRALSSKIAKQQGWRIMKRSEQVPTLQKWHRRGVEEIDEASAEADLGEHDVPKRAQAEVADACLRCYKGTEEGTHGFFVAGFVRDTAKVQVPSPVREESTEHVMDELEDSWNGFSDDDGAAQQRLLHLRSHLRQHQKRPWTNPTGQLRKSANGNRGRKQ